MIKGFKNMKMATIITLSVAVISLLCLSCLYLVMTSSVTQTSKQSSIDNMYTALDGQANMIELFVQESERSLRQYATADELKELLLAPDNALNSRRRRHTPSASSHNSNHGKEFTSASGTQQCLPTPPLPQWAWLRARAMRSHPIRRR